MPSLDVLPLRQTALVQALRLNDRDATWLRAVGLGEGSEVTLLRRAPLGGPLHVRVSTGAELAIDRELARQVELQVSEVSPT